jgi:predicted DNA-binding protein (UPF0251 family)
VRAAPRPNIALGQFRKQGEWTEGGAVCDKKVQVLRSSRLARSTCCFGTRLVPTNIRLITSSLAASSPRPDKRPAARQTQVRLDPHQIRALATAYRAGEATKEIAARFGIHRATVTAILHRLGAELRQRGLTDEQVAEACRLYPEGWSLARLAERYDVTDMTVRRILLLAGIAMRSPHER